MVDDFIKYTTENNLLKGGTILLAVSGGIDSMVMAHIFAQRSIPCAIAHCNFSLRGRESDRDEDLVRKFAAGHKMKFHTKRFDTSGYAGKNGISIQMAARDLRYEWFEEVRSENGYESVAVAHNLNDHIETLLINLTRGTGITGLTGIKVSSNNVIRPLLFAPRTSIAEYSKANKVRFREDSSNPETKYTRNKIRHLVIPVLKKINPSIETTLNDTAHRMSETRDIVNYFTDNLRAYSFVRKEENYHINIAALRPFESNITLIYELFRPFGITGNNAGDLINVIAGSAGGQVITGEYRIMKDRNEIIITKNDRVDFVPIVAGSLEELKKIPWIISAEVIKTGKDFNIPKDPDIACLDIEKVSFPLTFRKWKPGDAFYPLGMKKNKKLSDYFIDRKIPLAEKENILIMESAGAIAWIPGERIDNRFRITEKTCEALIIRSSVKASASC
jgi:tRNA(Ile)-lysidine synthase